MILMSETGHMHWRILSAGTVMAAVLAAAAGCGGQGYKPAAARTVTVTKSVPVTPSATASPAPTATSSPATTVTVTASPSAAPPASTAALTNAEAVVTQFYQDITDGDYAGAWALGGDNVSSGVSYANWVAGYSTTASITLDSYSHFGSSTVYASLTATQTDGTVKTYSGTYTVSGGVIVAAHIVQTS
jgi:hypothetical protein